MKKLFIIILVLCLCIPILAGCNNQRDEIDESATPAPDNSTQTLTPTEISTLTAAELFIFDSATNTLIGFQDSISGVTDIVIPEEMDGTAVRVIASNAFYGKGLNSVILPDTLEKIGSRAFSDNNIAEIILPSNLSIMENEAFGNNEITEVSIPESVTVINIGVFRNNKLTKITLPDTITHIKRNAFQKNMLVEVIIPPLVTVIESYTFQNNLIENVVFHDGVERIDGRSFETNKLSSLTIPASVKLIGTATVGASPTLTFERYPFGYNQITTITILGSFTEIDVFFLAENNNFRNVYNIEGAGTYTGTQLGKWGKTD